MPNYLRTLAPIEIYNHHSEDAYTAQKIEADRMIRYNREKRRNGINWMEIYLENDSVAYIKKDKTKIFLCEYVVLDDTSIEGFDYTHKTAERPEFHQLFKQAIAGQYYKATTQVKRLKDDKNNSTEYIGLEYDPDVIDVKPFYLRKKARFYITNKHEKNFIEIDNLQGAKGYALADTASTETKDLWMVYLVGVFAVVGAIAGFVIALALGWIVIGLIMLIPGLIVGAIVAFILKLVVMILEGIFHQIRKRL